METSNANAPLRSRLIQAALDCFLADDYHKVSTRRIAECAGANVSMTATQMGQQSMELRGLMAFFRVPGDEGETNLIDTRTAA